VRSEKVDELVAETLTRLQSGPELVELAYQAARETAGNESNYSAASLLALETAQIQSRTADEVCRQLYGAEITPQAIYVAKMRELTNEEVALKKQIVELKKKSDEGLSTLEPVRKVFLTGNSAHTDYLDANEDGKRILVQELLWNLSISGQKVQAYQFKNSYAELAKEPKATTFSLMCTGQDSNLRSPKAQRLQRCVIDRSTTRASRNLTSIARCLKISIFCYPLAQEY
jgi:hypothetical protein